MNNLIGLNSELLRANRLSLTGPPDPAMWTPTIGCIFFRNRHRFVMLCWTQMYNNSRESTTYLYRFVHAFMFRSVASNLPWPYQDQSGGNKKCCWEDTHFLHVSRSGLNLQDLIYSHSVVTAYSSLSVKLFIYSLGAIAFSTNVLQAIQWGYNAHLHNLVIHNYIIILGD